MINPILQKDDTFIRISKYGHVFGIVKSIGFKTVSSIDHKCSYLKPILISTNGIEYDLNECYKVRKQYTEEELDKLKHMVQRLQDNDKFISFEQVKTYHNTKRDIDNL